MPENRDFSHLPLPFLYRGKPKLRGFNSPSERTNRNRNNRAHHGEYLKRRSSELSQFWKERRINRLEEDLPEIQVGIPILLEIEPSSNIEFLRGLGFEIVCEIEDGFIIVASEDIDLTRFNQKANEFIQNISLRCNTPAKVYALCEDSDRLKRILSDDLYSKWATISADSTYFIDIGISCCGNIQLPDRPSRTKQETDQLPCWIRNFRILDEHNGMPQEVYPPKAISKAVEVYYKDNPMPTRIYNHSIGSRKPCAMKHMTPWAAEIDSQSYNNDVLYIQAAGNVYSDVIGAYWQAGYPYPLYLERELCRISDPAQSLQALTVGSVSDSDFETEDIVALGKSGSVSSFSRSGPGIWDVLKPEVVEYGGTHAYNKGSNPPILSTPPEVCPELIRKSPQGPAFARDAIGTSFAAPKVTYIATQIEKSLPEAPALLYRALIAQSARWPQKANDLTKEDCVSMLRHIGYGIPDVHRATSNDEYRITLITPVLMELGDNEAHIFQIPIPEELSSVGEDYDILIEITLSYAANPRRTRRHIKGYLSTWLDWCCSRIGESAETFAQRIFETGSVIEDDGDFDWVLGEATNRGFADGYSRKKGTLQKDWCIIKSNQLSDAFCVAVRGHKGWGGLFKAKYSLAVSFEAINQDIPIYEPIRTEIETTIENKEIEVEMPDSK